MRKFAAGLATFDPNFMPCLLGSSGTQNLADSIW